MSEGLDMDIDVAVIGGGAAGLTAAIFAAEAAREAGVARRVVVFEGAGRIGAKILVSGGGRCNVTHAAVRPEDYQGPRTVIRNVLRGFDERATKAWFESMGVALKREETGKLFPVSDEAQTVVDALLRRCAELGVTIQTRRRVTAVGRAAEGFVIEHGRGATGARRVVMATGGRSLPKTGSDGAGWAMVRAMGHTVTPTYPALVPLVLAEGFFHAELSGLAHEAELTTVVGGKAVDRRRGSLLWTHFGVSGPVVMDASRFWVMAHERGESPELRCAALAGETFERVEGWLMEESRRMARRRVAAVLAEKLPRRLAEALAGHAGVEGDSPVGQVTREARRALVHALTGLVLPVVRDRGWNYAEVTAGGVPMGEVDFRTMASRIVPGLYLVGEMLDVEGRIGGFNFQWAWATGYAAGRGAGVG